MTVLLVVLISLVLALAFLLLCAELHLAHVASKRDDYHELAQKLFAHGAFPQALADKARRILEPPQ